MGYFGKWKFAALHAPRIIKGLIFFDQPAWVLKLFLIRCRYFFTRRFSGPITTPDGFFLETENELISYWSFFVERECWASEWAEALKEEPGATVIDVGANAGLFTHWIWTLQPKTDFILFEPLPKMAKKIERWQNRTGASARLYNTAVSDRCGTAVFFASAENDTSASLKPEGIKSTQLQVSVVTLDSIVPKQSIFLVKIDVEGCECDVLAGGKKTLSRTRFLVIEAHSKEALAKIQDQLGSNWNCKQIGASDYFFTRNSKITLGTQSCLKK
jgi:2-O-methyltransferase